MIFLFLCLPEKMLYLGLAFGLHDSKNRYAFRTEEIKRAQAR